MATRKTVTAEEAPFEADKNLEVAEAAVEKEIPEVKDPWEEKIPMVVPRKPKGEDQQYYICVNDRRFMVPANGKVQELPKPVAEVLQESLQAEYDADDYADHIPNRSGEQPQQHAI